MMAAVRRSITGGPNSSVNDEATASTHGLRARERDVRVDREARPRGDGALRTHVLFVETDGAREREPGAVPPSPGSSPS